MEANTSNKVRDAMAKKQIKGKKEFMVFVPDVRTHTGNKVGEVKLDSFKSVSPELE